MTQTRNDAAGPAVGSSGQATPAREKGTTRGLKRIGDVLAEGAGPVVDEVGRVHEERPGR